MYETYDGAFAALACLRSALMSLRKALKQGNMTMVGNHAREVAYFTNEFQSRRNSARAYRRHNPC
jgi:hypothetical protein